MSVNKIQQPDYLFEVSWEVCNKIGGIHTVVATKALNLAKDLENRHILIGPDVWRDTAQNPEFTEDHTLFRTWRGRASEEGLRVRVGRWNVVGEPIAILVDFSNFISKKDEILTDFWKKFTLDSLSGQWDYVESVLFGYAAGKVIESFIHYNVAPGKKSVVQFHEWMTGSGLLYLKDKKVPVGKVFTTHATVIGRCLAGNNLPLYGKLQEYKSDDKAREFNVMAKHSLEKVSALNSDVFTTVSEITANECKYLIGKDVDIITPNGFEENFIPDGADLESDEREARAAMINMAAVMSGTKVSENALIIGTGGRYEYKNKGIDVFLDSLADLKNSNRLEREVLAFLFIPAGHNGPDKELLNKLKNGSNYKTNSTHYLHEADYDRINNRLKELNLFNKEGDKVKVFFVPSYLNGNDGVFNMTYYRLLTGLDLSVFPSYYEPWGYTPLESLAFAVPTVTTSLAGFGSWIQTHCTTDHPAAEVVERDEDNYGRVVSSIVSKIIEISKLDEQKRNIYKQNAREVSKIALWDNLIIYYRQAYDAAIRKIVQQKGDLKVILEDKEHISNIKDINKPNWARVLISKQLPQRLQHLDTLSKNLWWCWNQEAIELFESIDRKLWEESKGNPILMLDKISLKRYQELEANNDFLRKLDSVYASFETYMSEKDKMQGPKVAYFSMEYGLDKSLKIYSGGLGILAGDYLKESSDKMVPITGVGLLYRYGYFTQKLSSHGDQVAQYDAQDFMKIPVTPVRDEEGNWVTISIALPGRNMYARLWRVDIGRTELILMDTDFEDNLPEDRAVTHHLYGGDWENRLKQELLLGIGGIRALRTLKKEAEIYHCNEGHAAFIGLERLREYIAEENLTFGEAVEAVRSSSLFTTHTPVPAGHDSFSEDLLRGYMSHYPNRLKITWEGMMALGKIHANDPEEKFSMSILAANMSQEINGVSWLHGKVSQDILAPMWPGYLPEELNVSYVTNGVHYPTWTAPEWKEIHSEVFGADFASHHYDKKCFEGIYDVEDERIWAVRSKLRTKLIEAVKESLSDPEATTHYAPHHIVAIKEALRDDILTIGFARRFATYKRAHLLFKNLDRLNQIVNNPEMPVQFLFAGKAHPADKAGQELIKRIVEVSLMPEFIGKIVFIPGYDMTIARKMVQGVDIWMNTPTRPLEASGTSGEKAVMNGVMHFSVLDGWWVEGYKEGAGWALPMNNTYSDTEFQDELDAATIYNMLENDIAPVFYNVDSNGLSSEWIEIIKNTIAHVAANFTTNRMLNDYQVQYYEPMSVRHHNVVQNDYAMARELAFWKKKVRREWPLIEVRSYSKLDNAKSEMVLGNDYTAEVELYLGELSPEDIGVEILIAEQNNDNRMVIKERFDFVPVSIENSVAKYTCNIKPETAGLYNVAARIYPKNPHLPHRQDFDLVKWL